MLPSYTVASLILAGLSVAHPRRNFTVSAPLSATITPHSAHTSFVTPASTTASFGGQISSPSQLSRRRADPGDGGDWDDVVGAAINQAAGIPGQVLSAIFGGHVRGTEHVTVTAPGTFATITVTSEPEKTTGPVTVTTTLVTVPIPAKTETVHMPQETGCYYAQPDGGIGVGPCHDPL